MWPAALPLSVESDPHVGGTPLLLVGTSVTPVDLLTLRVLALEQDVAGLRAHVEAIEATLARTWWDRLRDWVQLHWELIRG